MTYIQTILNDVLDLVYPRLCAACVDNKPSRGGLFCIPCLSQLPETDYHLIPDNAFERQFWGRLPLRAGAAMLFFVPGGRTQTLLHNIKYQGYRHFAEDIGRIYGEKLLDAPRFASIDCIVPVPLHWRKLHKRGFNQSEAFGAGLSESLDVKMVPHGLRRVRHTATQTRKSRESRVQNMKDAFHIDTRFDCSHQHVLLVDDVLTTGATLESCALKLLEREGTTVSMVTLACGRV